MDEEVAKYRKKSRYRPPKKADHKHEYEDVLLEWWNTNKRYEREKGFIADWDYALGQRCKKCGKARTSEVQFAFDQTSRAYKIINPKKTYPNLPIVRVENIFGH